LGIYSAYEEGKDWHKELAEVMAEIAGGTIGAWAGPATLGILLNPFSCSAIIIIGLGITGSIAGQKIGGYLADWFMADKRT